MTTLKVGKFLLSNLASNKAKYRKRNTKALFPSGQAIMHFINVEGGGQDEMGGIALKSSNNI